jgi:hypothetical protein
LILWSALSFVQAGVTGKYYFHYFMPAFIPLSLLAYLTLQRTRWFETALLSLMIFGISLSLTRGAFRNFLGFRSWSTAISKQCEAPFYYEGLRIAAYRVCDSFVPAKYMFPPFVRAPHFVAVSESGGRKWLCALKTAIIHEGPNLELKRFSSGAEYCAAVPAE